MDDLNIQAGVTVNAEQAERAFTALGDKAQKMANEVTKAADKAGKATDGMGDGAEKGADKFTRAESRMRSAIQKSTRELEMLGKTASQKFEAQLEFKGLDKAKFQPFLAELRKTEEAAAKAQAGVSGIGDAAKVAGSMMAAAFSGAALLGVVGKVVSVQREFDVLNSSLKTVTGSSAAAEREMAWLKDFAKETPFGLAQATQGFVKMKALGLDPTRAALNSFGNTASAMGKDLNQMIEAVADASTGEFERLKEFGIKAKKEGDNVSLTFQGVTTTIKNSAAEITAYLEKIGNNQFGGAMEERAKTLDGTIAALGDTWDELFRTVSTNNVGGLIFDSVTLANGALEDATTILKAMGGAAREAGEGTGALVTIQSGIATVFETVSVLGANLKFVLVGIGNEIGGLAAQVAQAAQFNFAGVRAIREQMVADAEAARREIDATTARILNARRAQEEYTRYATRNASAATDPRRIDLGGSTPGATTSGKPAKGAKEALSDYDKLIQKLGVELPRAAAEAEAAQLGYNKAQTEFLALAGSDVWAKFSNDQRAAVAALFEQKILSEEAGDAAKTLTKANLDAAASREKYVSSLATGIEKIKADIAAQVEATQRMGLSKEAIADLDAAKLEMLATDTELQAIKALDRNLDQQTYDALKEQARLYRDLAEAKKGGAAKEAALDLEKANKEAAKKAEEEWKRSVEKYDDIFRNGFADMLNNGKSGWKSFTKSLVTTFKTTVADQIYKMFLQPFVVNIVGNLMGLAGGGVAGAAVQAASGGVGGVGSALSTASTLGSLGSGVGLLGAGGLGLQAGFGALMSGGFAGIGAAVTGGLAAIGTGVGSSIAAGLGTIAGALGPIAIGAALLYKPLFGRTLKDSGIQGQFGGASGFEGETYEYYKGGLFRSNKTKTNPLAEEMRKVLGDTFLAMRVQVTTFADSLGLEASKIADFTTSLKISTKGLSDADAQKAIEEALQKANNELAEQIIGTWEVTTEKIQRMVAGSSTDAGDFGGYAYEEMVTSRTYKPSEFAKDGEKAIDTLTRLSTSLTTVNGIWSVLGNTLMEASLAGADAASHIADAFGGLEAMAAATGSYVQNFYSASEQRDAARRQLETQFASLDLKLPDIDASNAREQYRLLAEAQDRNTEEGLKAYVALIQLSGAFAGLTMAADDAATAAKTQAQLRSDAYSALERAISAEKQALQSQLDVARDVASTIGDIFEILHSNVRDLYGEVDSTRAMQASQGSDFINQALAVAKASGYLPDADKLSEAISAARGGINAGAYASQFAADRDRLVLAGKLSGLEEIAGKQLTDAQRSVRELETHTEQLDKTLDYWSQQIDIASGTYEGVLSVAAAVNQLSNLLGGGAAAGGGGGGGGSGGGGGGSLNGRDRGTVPRANYGAEEALTSFDKFKAWYQGLATNANTAALQSDSYQVPDWMRLTGMLSSGENDALFGQYLNFKNNPQFATDFEQIMTTGRSSLATDGSTLVRSDLSKMPTDVANYFKGDQASLLSYEGFGLDPVLAYKLYKDGPEQFGLDIKRENFTEWLRTHKWTEGGIVEANNTLDYANASYSGYNLSRWDTSSGNIIDLDGKIYSPDGKYLGTAGKDLMNSVYGAAFVGSTGGSYGATTNSALYNQQIGAGSSAQDYYSAIKSGLDAAIASGTSAQSIADAITSTGASMQDVANAYGITVAQLAENLANGGATNIPKFDVGTNYVPRDMLAYIDEGEAVVPKAYNPAANGGTSGGSARLELLVEQLLAKVASLELSASETAGNTRPLPQLGRQFDTVSNGGTVLRNKAVA